MCTVTIFYKGNNDFVLTSNRDEAPNRVALSPDFYTINASKVLMPKDEQSGGSWIGASDTNRVVCLLNGGFNLHERKESYRQSRGVVVTDLLTAVNIENAVKQYDFEGIEPFTMVIADWNTNLKFYELVWNEDYKHFEQLPLETKIWSSTTLYSEKMKEERRNWFNNFKLNTILTAKSLLQFHTTAGKDNLDYGVIMDREVVKTTSITQFEKTKDLISVSFNNLNTTETSIKTVNLVQTINE